MDMNDRQIAQELSNFYNRINLIFHAILALPLVAFVWLYLESKAGNISPLLENQSTIGVLSFVSPILIIGLIVGAFFLFKSGLRTINPNMPLLERISIYSKKSMLLYAMLEMGLILSVLGYYLTQENVFLAMSIIVLIFFSLYKPTFERTCNQLNIKGEEREFVINSRSIARGERTS